jgi:carboxypeptidase Taq
VSYSALEEHHRRIHQLDHACAILDWDQAVIMPERAGSARAESLSTLRGLRHELATEPRLLDLLDQGERERERGNLNDWQVANLREMSRQYRRAICVPRDLVEASSRAEAHSEQAWRVLRAQNDWNGFRPHLEEVVSLKRQTAAALSDALGCTAYDALVDGFEAGIGAAQIDVLFDDLRAFLPGFLERGLERQRLDQPVIPRGPFDTAAQKELGRSLMAAVGFDFSIGRLDVSHHPFCGGVPRDVRITTRYREDDFTSSLMGVLHETGHAKYEQGLPEAWLHQPVGVARGMATHESQSLFGEMLIARSPAFLQFAAQFIRDAFPVQTKEQPGAFEPRNLYLLSTRIRPGLIRVDADEVTYPSHVILRYEIERDLIAGKCEVKDIPELWESLLGELLGLSCRGNDKDGCMQDVHWPAGAFGYFPLYTVGALLAAQLHHAVQRDIPDLNQQIAGGEFGALDAWLRERIWSKASLLGFNELVIGATGEALNPIHFKQHLQRRYLDRVA